MNILVLDRLPSAHCLGQFVPDQTLILSLSLSGPANIETWWLLPAQNIQLALLL